jgi:hypothetical protein
VDAGGGGSGWGTAVDGGPTVGTGPIVAGTVTVSHGTTMGHLGSAFAGLSFEKTHLTDAFFTGSNAPLIALFKLLGPSLVRFGGNAVDLSNWQPAAMPAAPGMISTGIGTVDVDSLADFLNATGWKALYAVNLNTSTADVAAAEAKYAAGKLGASLYGFEIGNEISEFGRTYAAVTAQWSSFASAIKTVVPTATFTGPACDGTGVVASWAVPFARDEASTISLLTQHYYRGDGATGTMAKMLAYPATDLIAEMKQLSGATTANHIRDGFRYTDTNSFVDHGTEGVSDALGAALWSIDHMLTIAQAGGSGVNFHGGGPNQDLKHLNGFWYTPIGEANSKVTEAMPVFYGMLLVTLAGTGDMLATTASAAALNFSAYAIAQPDGSTNIVLDNKEATSNIQASVDVGAAVTVASAIALQGPSLTSTSGLTIAGAGISPEGQWNGNPPYSLSATGNVVNVMVPAATAVLVHAQ